MKAKLALVAPLVAVLALVLVAGPALGKAGSITGGGWFLDSDENKITFSFNVFPTSEGPVADATGRFQLIDHGSKTTRMYGTIENIYITEPTELPFQFSEFSGRMTSIKGGDEGPDYTVFITDGGDPGWGEGDGIGIIIYTDPWTWYGGELGGGNLKIHEK